MKARTAGKYLLTMIGITGLIIAGTDHSNNWIVQCFASFGGVCLLAVAVFTAKRANRG